MNFKNFINKRFAGEAPAAEENKNNEYKAKELQRIYNAGYYDGQEDLKRAIENAIKAAAARRI